MSTAIEPSDPEYVEAFESLKAKHRQLVIDGEVKLYPGRGYPVLRWSSTNTKGKKPGTLVPGTSLLPNENHGNVGIYGKSGAYKRTNAYKELMQYLIPATDDPEVYGGLAWMLNEGFKQVEGGEVKKDVICPECSHQFEVTAYKRGDSRALQTMLEQVLDKPNQRQDINLQGEVYHEYLNAPIDVDTITVYSRDPREAEKIKKVIEVDFVD